MLLKFYRIFIIFLLKNSFADPCDYILNLGGEYQLKLSETSQEEPPSKKIEEVAKLNSFIGDVDSTNYSQLFLQKRRYDVESCTKGILTVITKAKEEKNFKIDDIITYPIVYDQRQIKSLRSKCQILSNFGIYKVMLQQYEDTTTNTHLLKIYKMLYDNYYFANLNTVVKYVSSDLDKMQVDECKDYSYLTSKLKLKSNNTTYGINKIEVQRTRVPKKFINCALLTIKGNYNLIQGHKILGTITIKDSPHKSSHSLLENNEGFKVIYNSKFPYPELKFLNGEIEQVQSCTEYPNNFIEIKFDRSDLLPIRVDSVQIINQDLGYLLNVKQDLLNRIEKESRLKEPIHEDIEQMLKNLWVPSKELQPNQHCRDLFYPGIYNIYSKSKGERPFKFKNLEVFRLYRSLRDPNNYFTAYRYFGSLNDGPSKKFTCQDTQDKSIFSEYIEQRGGGGYKSSFDIGNVETLYLASDSESWLSNTHKIIILRSPNLCKDLYSMTDYTIKGPYGVMSLSIGNINSREFAFYAGYTINFDSNSYINGGDRNFDNEIVTNCHSNDHVDSLYLDGFDEYRRSAKEKTNAYQKVYEIKFYGFTIKNPKK